MDPLGKTYTGDKGAIQSNIDSLTSQVTSGIKGSPAVQQQMGESILGADQGMQTLGDQRGQLIQDLFNADKEMSAKYSNPAPENPMYIENPMAREAAVGRNQNTVWGALGSLNTTISARKSLLGDALTRGMALYQSGLDAKKLELDHEYKRLDLIDRAEQRAADAKWKQDQATEQTRQFEEKQKLDREQAAGKSSLSSAAVTKLSEWDAAERQLQTVKALYEKAKNKVGPLGGTMVKSPLANLDMFRDPDLDKLNQAVRTLQLMVEKPLIGTQQSIEEMKKVAQFIPNVSESTGRFLDKMTGLTGYINNNKLAISSGGGISNTASAPAPSGTAFSPPDLSGYEGD